MISLKLAERLCLWSVHISYQPWQMHIMTNCHFDISLTKRQKGHSEDDAIHSAAQTIHECSSSPEFVTFITPFPSQLWSQNFVAFEPKIWRTNSSEIPIDSKTFFSKLYDSFSSVKDRNRVRPWRSFWVVTFERTGLEWFNNFAGRDIIHKRLQSVRSEMTGSNSHFMTLFLIPEARPEAKNGPSSS